MEIIIRSPETVDEFRKYFDLRYRVLRKPWQQPEGSEKDELERSAIHLMAISEGNVIGVCRLHPVDSNRVQLRYMAVDDTFRKSGVGSRLLEEAENRARQSGATLMILNSRESAVPFYDLRGYSIIKETATMFGTIRHFLMEKKLV